MTSHAAAVGSAPDELAGFEPAFDRDRFLLRQKHLALSPKYYVFDDAGEPILFVHRPVFVLRTLAAFFAAIGAFFAIAVGGLAAGLALASLAGLPNDPAAVVGVVTGAVLGLVGAIFVGVLIGPKRHVHFYRDDSRAKELLRVLQDRKFTFLVATYTILGEMGEPLGGLRKNCLHDIFRKRWECFGPGGELVCVIQEDSVIKALARRFLGPMYGLLRTNFVLLRPGSGPEAERRLGAFNRKFTLLDRYVLDLTSDPGMELDRRVALAIGVMLDTGERR